MTRRPNVDERILRAILARAVGLDEKLPGLSPDQALRLSNALAVVPWTEDEKRWIKAAGIRPHGGEVPRLPYWDQERGLNGAMLYARLKGNVPSEALGLESTLLRRLSGNRNVSLALLEATCAEAGVTLPYVLGDRWERPFHLLDFVMTVEAAHATAPAETRALLEALRPLVALVSSELRGSKKRGTRAVLELTRMIDEGRPAGVLGERLDDHQP